MDLLKQSQTETEAGFLNVGHIAVSINDTTRANYQLLILGDLSLNAINSDSNQLNFLLSPISSFLLYFSFSTFYPFHPFPQFVSPCSQYLFSLPTHLNYIFISFSLSFLSFCYLYFALFHFFCLFSFFILVLFLLYFLSLLYFLFNYLLHILYILILILLNI